MRIRDAVPEDAPSLVEIANAVRLRDTLDAEQQNRGFLIDISLEKYQYFIANDHALVMEELDSGQPVGFSVILGPRTMAATGIREKAQRMAQTTLPVRELDPEACAYWEQIAFLPRHVKGLSPVYLAFAGVRSAFHAYRHLFAAVAGGPVSNLAPLRFLDCAGGKKVGWIDEDYPAYGRIRYDIYHLDRSDFEERLRAPWLARLEERTRALVAAPGDDEKGGGT